MVKNIQIREDELNDILLLLFGTTNIKLIEEPKDNYINIQNNNVILVNWFNRKLIDLIEKLIDLIES